MHLVRTPQGEIKEVSVVGENTELSVSEVSALLAGEAASVELLNSKLAEYPSIISDLETKKALYTNGDADAIQSKIDKLTLELSQMPGQKQSAKDRVTLYNKYV